jgi:hypothetical protein
MKKIKQLILHIGTKKTGSSSIQQSLGKSRLALHKYNIHYPNIRPFNHLVTFLPIFIENPGKAFNFRKSLKSSKNKHSKVMRYRNTWVYEIEDCTKDYFIISAEGLTGANFTIDAIKVLQAFVERYFKEVTIIAYVRHYDQWIPSQIQQAIKNGNFNLKFDEVVQLLMRCPPGMSYQNSLEKWIKVFGREKLVVRPFDPKVFYKGSLLADFLHFSKLPVDADLIPEIRSNDSIGKHAVTFLQKYNQIYPVFINNSVNKDRGLARKVTPDYLYRDLASDEKFKLELVYTPEQAKGFNEEIDFVNQFFTDGYQFHHVSSGSGDIKIPIAEEIPVEFFVELVNNYNKRLDELLNHNANLQRKLKGNIMLLIAQILNRLPLLKSIIRKIF